MTGTKTETGWDMYARKVREIYVRHKKKNTALKSFMVTQL